MKKRPDDTGDVEGVARFMVLLAWGFAIAFAAYLFQQLLDDRFNPNADLPTEGSPEVVLQRNAQGHYVANGLIESYCQIWCTAASVVP